MGDIDGGFPSDSRPHAEDYDYLSDSDLEDACGDEEEPQEYDDGNSQQRLESAEVMQAHQPVVSHSWPPGPSSAETIEPQNDNRSTPFPIRYFFTFVNPGHSANDNLPRTGKVAIVRDVGAITYVSCGLTLSQLTAKSQV